MPTRRPLAYLAGPEVFLPASKQLGEQKKKLCDAHGLEGVFPLDKEPQAKDASPTVIAHEIFEICIDLMDSCDLIIANMTPFRGVSMDVGTAIEVGYMFGKGKPVFGYTNLPVSYHERVVQANLEMPGEIVENYDYADNLMCEVPVQLSAGVLVRGHAPTEELLTDLAAFEECVANAARVMGIDAG